MRSQDRRVERTRERLQDTLMALIQSCGYDAVTIQELADCANVGRTTFYLHFESKEDLYRHAHQAEVARMAGAALTSDELLADKPPVRMIAVYEYHWAQRELLRVVYFGKDAEMIHRQMRDYNVDRLTTHLQTIFPDTAFTVPIDVLANYLVEAEMMLMTWWVEKRAAYTPEQLALYFHRLRRAALREALGIVGSIG